MHKSQRSIPRGVPLCAFRLFVTAASLSRCRTSLQRGCKADLQSIYRLATREASLCSFYPAHGNFLTIAFTVRSEHMCHIDALDPCKSAPHTSICNGKRNSLHLRLQNLLRRSRATPLPNRLLTTMTKTKETVVRQKTQLYLLPNRRSRQSSITVLVSYAKHHGRPRE